MNQEEAREAFEYRDGHLYRKKAAGGYMAGSRVGWVTECNGSLYRKMNFKGKTTYVHRVIFLIEHGYLPDVIDHANRGTLDNRIENLRAATQVQNMGNTKLSAANTSGRKGVTYRKDTGKWAAQIMFEGKHISLGSHADIEDAAKAYEVASVMYFGEFSRSQEATNRGQERTTR